MILHVDFNKKKLLRVIRDRHNISPIFERFNEFINNGLTRVAFTSQHSGVQIHQELRWKNDVLLNWSKKFGNDDFMYDDAGVRGTLSVAGRREFINVPWKCVKYIESCAGDTKGQIANANGELLSPIINTTIKNETTQILERPTIKDHKPSIFQKLTEFFKRRAKE